jgi:uncharacterized protein with PQ loop repeat
MVTGNPEIVVPPLRAAIANVAGSTSLACWIVLLLPQLIEQWRTKSADGISIGFLVIWALGDIANLLGALWAKLLPEVILLALWYCIADTMLIISWWYYKNNNSKEVVEDEEGQEDPTQPLLNRRNSAAAHQHEHHDHDTLTEAIEETTEQGSVFTRIILPILFVIAAGILGFVLSSGSGEQPEPSTDLDMGPQILGYISAFLYLGARIPQIIQNHRRRSVYGLSLLFFIFSTMGNLTYALQILIYRYDSKWIILNLSWLLGSLGTIFEDVVIFIQFYIYNGGVEDDDDAN